MARPKNILGVAQIGVGKEPTVIERFTTHEECMTFLAVERAKLTEGERFNIVAVPLGPKGEPYLPPGTRFA